MLVLGLLVSGCAYLGFGLAPSYSALLIAMVFVGLSNAVFHPADYALLSRKIVPDRLGRAFSIHTFAGFLGTAIAPVTMIALAAFIGLNFALMAAGILALVVAVPLVLARTVDNDLRPLHRAPSASGRGAGMTAILTPTIIGLTGFFALMSLSGSGISNFSVVALTSAFGTSLSVANLALTAYLSAQALGVLAGGFVADVTRRHGEVAAVGYAVNACIVLAIGTMGLAAAPLIVAMAAAGLLSGMIMPSRDMLVRAAAPPGAMGRTFGIVTSGFGMGGMVGPLMFGFAMDHGAPQWVFGISVILMIAVAALALVGDRRASAATRGGSLPRPIDPSARRTPGERQQDLVEHRPLGEMADLRFRRIVRRDPRVGQRGAEALRDRDDSGPARGCVIRFEIERAVIADLGRGFLDDHAASRRWPSIPAAGSRASTRCGRGRAAR